MTVPAATPVTTPPVVIVAVPVAALAHVPPAEVSESVKVLPTHTAGEEGEIAPTPYTESGSVDQQPPAE